MRERRSDYHQKNKKPKGCLIFLGIILFLVLGAGIVLAGFINNIEKTVSTVQVARDPRQINLRQELAQNQDQVEETKEIIEEQQAFSILLLGIDNEESAGVKGRSDIIVVTTINPNTQKLTLTSIPRDSLTEIVGRGTEDKINHAYAFGGISMAANTVQNLLEIPIDYTLAVNMEGFTDIIDIIGGINVTASETFQQDGYQFIQGQNYQMDGDMVLAYIRNRKDSGGDYGRQNRARQVIEAAIKEAASFDALFNISEILDTLQGNVVTDLPLDNILGLVQDYRGKISTVETYQLEGDSAMIDGIYYEILDDNSLNQVKNNLQEQLEL